MNHELPLPEPLHTVVRALAECLVSHPGDLRFEFAESAKQVCITINGHRDDIGKLMGKECRNVKAVQAIANLVTEKEAKEARVNIAEGWTGDKGAARPKPPMFFENEAISRLGLVCRDCVESFHVDKVGTSTHLTLTVYAVGKVPSDLEPALKTVFKAFGGMHNRFVTIEVV